MRLTRKKVIELTKELWTWMRETGLSKSMWPKWKDNGGEYDDADCHCFFCEYQVRKEKRVSTKELRTMEGCGFCPYFVKYEYCNAPGTPFYNWDYSRDLRTRKKYAKKFLEQLKTL